MSCRHVEHDLKAYADRELGRWQAWRVRRHLAGCETCREELAGLRQVAQVTQSLPAAMPSPALRAAVLQAAADRPVTPARRPARLLALAAAAVAVLALALLLPRPTPGQAALQRTAAAMQRVDTARIVTWYKGSDGSRQVDTTWYAGGKWRLEMASGQVQVYDGRQLSSYSPAARVVLTRTADRPFHVPFQGFTVGGMVAGERDVETTLRQMRQGGQLLNEVTVTRRPGGVPQERLVLLADPATDLPVSWQVEAFTGAGWQVAGGTVSLDFNLRLPARLFVLQTPPGTRTLDKRQWDAQWQRRYDHGLARADGVVLRDLQVTTIGDVYALWTGGGSENVMLTDDLGTAYLPDDADSLVAPEPGRARFVPLHPLPALPRHYTLLLARAPGSLAGPVELVVDTPLRSPFDTPLYPSMERSWLGGHWVQAKDELARAHYWQEQGDDAQALRHYEAAAQGERALPEYEPMGGCYERLGLRAQARQAYQAGLRELDARQARHPEPADPYQHARRRLEEALSRLQ